jgi:hypothetical protein
MIPKWRNYNRVYKVAAMVSVLRFVEASQDELDINGMMMCEAVHAETYLDIH